MLRPLIIMLLAVVSIITQAQTTLVIGNANIEEEGSLEFVGQNSGVGFATQFNRFKMRAYVGCQLSSLSVYVDGSNVSGKVFVTTSLTSKTRLAEQSFTTSTSGWNEIVFDTPWTVTQTAVYIGYELDKAATGVINSVTPLVVGTEYINIGNGWEPFAGKCGKFYATVSGDKVPQNEISLGAVNMPSVTSSGRSFSPTAEIINLGSAEVKSIEVAYSINGEQDVRTATVEGLSISPRQNKLVTLPAIVFDEDGDYNVATEVTRVNGIADAAPFDNAADTKLIYSRGTMPERKILMEVFSTEKCTGCPEGHETIEKVLGKKTNIVEIGHHAGFYNDQFTIPASTAYEWFYKTPEYTTSYAPAVMLDRTNMRVIHGNSFAMDVPLFEPSAQRLNAAYNTQNVEPGYAVISINPTYDKAYHKLDITVDAELAVVLSEHTNPVLNVFLTEDSVFSMKQANAIGNYYHHNVARVCLSGIWGDPIDLKTRKLSATYSANIDDAWDVNRLAVVAFVSNYDKTSNNKCKVLNAEKVAVCDDNSSFIASIKQQGKLIETYYLNASGQKSASPHRGMNIVVKRYENSINVSKTLNVK